MRQGGMVPKSHKSGVYWTRATSRSGKGTSDKNEVISTSDIVIYLVILPLTLLVCLVIFPFKMLFSKNSDNG
jgi:hypothetical protein